MNFGKRSVNSNFFWVFRVKVFTFSVKILNSLSLSLPRSSLSAEKPDVSDRNRTVDRSEPLSLPALKTDVTNCKVCSPCLARLNHTWIAGCNAAVRPCNRVRNPAEAPPSLTVLVRPPVRPSICHSIGVWDFAPLTACSSLCVVQIFDIAALCDADRRF